MKFWLNGKLLDDSGEVSRSKSEISAHSAGLNFGWGVFTTLGVRGGAALFLERHIHRLARDANAADVPLETDFAAIWDAVGAVLRANKIENGLARLTLTQRGDERWNTETGADLSIFALENGKIGAASQGLHAQMSPFRVEAKRALVGVKTTAYLPYFWAWREAKARGFDEAILREGQDFWCEGARSTLFWVQNEEIYTPALETGCLRGIGRELVLEWAASSQIRVHQGRFLSENAENAEEMWLVSAASGSRPLRALHDENGAAQLEFAAKTPLCDEFSRWFSKQSESQIRNSII